MGVKNLHELEPVLQLVAMHRLVEAGVMLEPGAAATATLQESSQCASYVSDPLPLAPALDAAALCPDELS